jgi:nitroreductase
VFLTACNVDSTEPANANLPPPVTAADPIDDILQKRHSGYSFDSTRSVTSDQIQSIIKAGRSAPSSYNDQPWYFIICDRTTNPAAYNKVFNTLVGFNQNWVKNVPLLIVSVASANSHKGAFNRWAQYDTGAAAFSMMLQATSLGLMAHQMGGFDELKLREVFGISQDFVPMAVMAIGYAAEGDVAIEKDRKPISENFFMGTWNVAPH